MSQRGYSGGSAYVKYTATDIAAGLQMKKSKESNESVPALQGLKKCIVFHQRTALYNVASIHNTQSF